MLIIILLLGIVLIVSGVLIFKFSELEYDNGFGWVCSVVGVIWCICVFALFITGICNLVESRIIDAKIEMYVEENTNIETNVTTAVEKYLEHEFNVFDSLQGEDIQTLLVVYPEINSNELVKRQVEIFVENNNKIKELKEQKLNIEVWKWWVYFG